MIGIIYNLFGLFFWALFIYYYGEDVKILRDGILLGIFTAITYIVFITYNFSILLLIAKYNLHSMAEELISMVFLFIYPFGSNFIVKEACILGASAGLGFVFVENFLHMEYPYRILTRNLTSNLSSIITDIILSYGIWKYRKTNNKLWLSLYFLSVGIHHLYNTYISHIL